MSKIVIFGDGKYADVAYFYLTNDSPHDVVAFTADKKFITKKELFDLPVIPFEEIQDKYPPDRFQMMIAVGYQNLNRLRATKYLEAKEKGYELISYISSRASNFGDVEVGDNCFILENNSVQPCSKIGNDVTIWSNNVIGHHASIKDHCYISGHVIISGSSVIEDYCFLGVNTTIGHEITIDRECLIGAGTLITKNVGPKSVYITPDTDKYRLDSATFLRLTKMQ